MSSSLFKAAAGQETRQLLDYSDLDTPVESPTSAPTDNTAMSGITQGSAASTIPQPMKTGKKKKKTKVHYKTRS